MKHSEGGNAERRTSSVAGNAKGQMVGVVRGLVDGREGGKVGKTLVVVAAAPGIRLGQ